MENFQTKISTRDHYHQEHIEWTKYPVLGQEMYQSKFEQLETK